jgi:hypothetical protein
MLIVSFAYIFQTVVTDVGDETPIFWKVFSCSKSQVCTWHACYNAGVNYVCLTKYDNYLI